MTVTPARRAFSIAGTMAEELAGVIMMPLAPSAVIFASAATWLRLSMSLFPAAVSSLTLSSLAVSCAVSFIVTQNGFVLRLTMRPTDTGFSLDPHDQPATASPAAAVTASRRGETVISAPLPRRC